MRRIAPCSVAIIATLACPPALQAEDLGFAGTADALSLGKEEILPLSRSFNARLRFNSLSPEHDEAAQARPYDFGLRFYSASTLLDWHPLDSGFRLTGGLLYTQNEHSLRSASAGFHTLGDSTYSAAEVGNLTGDIRLRNLTPYLGIGWGDTIGKDRRLGFGFDLGLAFQGTPDVSLSADGSLASDPALRADLAREEQHLQDSMDWAKYYPVFSFGLTYQFE